MLQSIGGTDEQARGNGTEMKNTPVLSFFFSCLAVHVLLGPTSQDSRNPFVVFSYWSPLAIVRSLNKGNGLFFQDGCWPYFHLPPSIRMQAHTRCRKLEGRKGAFMKRELIKNAIGIMSVGRFLEWKTRSDCPEPQFNLTSVCFGLTVVTSPISAWLPKWF